MKISVKKLSEYFYNVFLMLENDQSLEYHKIVYCLNYSHRTNIMFTFLSLSGCIIVQSQWWYLTPLNYSNQTLHNFCKLN